MLPWKKEKEGWINVGHSQHLEPGLGSAYNLALGIPALLNCVLGVRTPPFPPRVLGNRGWEEKELQLFCQWVLSPSSMLDNGREHKTHPGEL